MELQKLEKEYLIHVYETGPDGRASLNSLFNYMQDIASIHAVKLGFGRDDLMRNNHFWVLSRMYAEITTMPVWEDKIVVRTWPSGTDKLFAMRNYEVYFPDGRPVANASSSWLIVDRSTRRIQRPDDLLGKYNNHREDLNSSPVRSAVKLSGCSGEGQNSEKFRVKTSDLDVNFHTNNVNYLKWIMDTYELDFVMNHIPDSVEINYLAESMFNNEISIRTSREDGKNISFTHSVFRTDDNKELCRILIQWKSGILTN